MSSRCYAQLQRLTRRFGNRYGVDMKLEDSLAAALVDQNPGGTKTPMGSEPSLSLLCVKSAHASHCGEFGKEVRHLSRGVRL